MRLSHWLKRLLQPSASRRLPIRRRRGVRLELEALESRLLPSGSALSVLASFNGTSPAAGLILDGSGSLYGTTPAGGDSSDGTIFQAFPSAGGVLITTLASFHGADGAHPQAGLVRDGNGNLFGVTAQGGANGEGVVFELPQGSTTVTALASFDGTNGAAPTAGLILDSTGDLFGTASQGGANGAGTVFELVNGGTTITALASFNGTNGSAPAAPLLRDSAGDLFGTAAQGGLHSDGTVFELAAGNSTIQPLVSFAGSDGADPQSALVRDGAGNLFGTTRLGGAGNVGTAFALDPATGALTTLASFNTTNGANPAGGLFRDSSGNLFGTTQAGGAASDGTVFEVPAANPSILDLASFDSAHGTAPTGLVADGTSQLFGTTQAGGDHGNGTLFSIAGDVVAPTAVITAPTTFSFTSNNQPTLAATVTDNPGGSGLASVQFQFSSDQGAAWTNIGTALTAAPFTVTPSAPLPDGKLQVRAAATDNAGNVGFSNSILITLTTLATFSHFSSAGSGPTGHLAIDATGDLFGTTAGGQFGAQDGTVYELSAGAANVTVLATFNGTNGSDADSGVILGQDGNLYGVTAFGGANRDGSIFEVVAGSGAITTLASFTGANGAQPHNVTLLRDGQGNLFGTTAAGGANGKGTIFELTAGNIVTLASFDGTNGAAPNGGLVLDSSGNFFGTASDLGPGGTGAGVVFELPAGTNAIRVAAPFTGPNGAAPLAGLTADAAGNLYGVTSKGGAANDGVVFELAAGASQVTVLANFTGANGALPAARLTRDAAGNLFGTADLGGSANDGVVFELTNGSHQLADLAVLGGGAGILPDSDLAVDATGNLYGATGVGVGLQEGALFKVGLLNTVTALTVDAHPPVATLTAPADHSFTINNQPTLTATITAANGIAGVLFELSSDQGATWTPEGTAQTTAPFSFTLANPLADGTYQARVDAADNLSGTTTSAVVTFTVDTKPPKLVSLDIVAPTTPATNGAAVTYVASFSEPVVGVTAANFHLLGTAAGAGVIAAPASTDGVRWTVPITGLGSANGTVTLALQTDAGIENLAGAPAHTGSFVTHTMLIDHVAPTVAIAAPLAGSFVGALPTLTASAADETGGSGVAGVQLQLSSDGGHSWQNAGPLQLTTPFTFTVTTPLAAGAYQVQALATDKAGNSTTAAAVGFTVDPLPPTLLTLNRATPAAAVTNAAGVTFTAVFNKPVTGVSAANFALSGSAGAGTLGTPASADGITWTIPVTGLAAANGTLELDLANNTGIADALSDGLAITTFSGQGFTLDHVAPTAVMTAPAAGSTTSTAPALAANVSDNAGGSGLASVQFQVSSDGGATWANVGNPLTGAPFSTQVGLPLALGAYEAHAVATDNAGNQTTSDPVAFNVNVVVLSLASINRAVPAAVFTNGSSVTFLATFSAPVTGVTAANFSLSGSAGAGALGTPATTDGGLTWSIPVTGLASANGTVELDLAGNAGIKDQGNRLLTTRQLSGQAYTLDHLAPTGTLTAPPTGSFTNQRQPTLSATVADNAGGSGIASVQFQLSTDGGATWNNVGAPETSAPFSVTLPAPLTDGTYAARALLADNVGNAGTTGASGPLLTTLASFTPALNPDGASGLVMDGNGNLFGTSGFVFSSTGIGTVFEVANGTNTISRYADSTSVTGGIAASFGGLTLDHSGNLFGAYLYTQTRPNGQLFEVPKGTHTVNTIGFFGNSSGGNPVGSLVLADNGDVYGTAQGGSAQDGIIYVLRHDAGLNVALLATFTGANGANPASGLVRDAAGDLFGATRSGGPGGAGTVFEVPTGTTTIVTLAAFNGANGAAPNGNLALDGAGNLFGATSSGGANNDGTLFEVVPATGALTTLATFNGANGAKPQAGLAIDAGGNLFGTTSHGGLNDDGVVFELAKGSAAIAPLVTFVGANGAAPNVPLIFDRQGNLLGTTPLGGANGLGTVFKVTPASAVATFTVDSAAPTVTLASIPSPTTGAAVSFSGTATTALGDLDALTIAIYRGSTAAGAPFQSLAVRASGGAYQVSPAALPDGTYTAQTAQTDAAGNVGLSSPRTFTVSSSTQAGAPKFTTQPSSLTVNVNASITFKVAATGTPAPTIQWQISTDGGVTFTNFRDFTGPTLVFATTADENGNQYRALGTNSAGVTASAAATLTVNVAPSLTLNPASAEVTAGQSLSFSAAATGTPLPTVQWQKSTDGGKTFTNIAHATSTSLAVTASQNGTEFRAVFTNAAGSAASTPAILTVDAPPTVTPGTPASKSATAGTSVSFTAAAAGTPVPTVQWQVSTDGGHTFHPIAGATNPTLAFTVNPAQSGNEYEAVFTNPAGTATSGAATLTVNTLPVVSSSPASQTVVAGQQALFTAAATGNPPPTVQWQQSTNGGSSFANVAGATALIYAFTPTAGQTGYQYRAVFTNAAGSTPSAAATLTVQTPPKVTTSPPKQSTVVAGHPASFTAAATGSPPPTVQWQVSTDGGTTFSDLAGATNATLSFTAAATQNGNRYRAVFTNAAGTATTAAGLLVVNAPPAIITPPAAQTIAAGQVVTFTAAASGNPPPAVQWQVSVNGGAFTNLAGARSLTLSFRVTAAQNHNKYRAVFTNSIGTITTTAAVLTVD